MLRTVRIATAIALLATMMPLAASAAAVGTRITVKLPKVPVVGHDGYNVKVSWSTPQARSLFVVRALTPCEPIALAEEESANIAPAVFTGIPGVKGHYKETLSMPGVNQPNTTNYICVYLIEGSSYFTTFAQASVHLTFGASGRATVGP